MSSRQTTLALVLAYGRARQARGVAGHEAFADSMRTRYAAEAAALLARIKGRLKRQGKRYE